MKKRKAIKKKTVKRKVAKPKAIKRAAPAPLPVDEQPAAAAPEAPPTTAQLLAAAPISLDRTGWARRGHAEFAPNQVLALEVNNNDLDAAAETLDHWAFTTSGRITEVQHVFRREKRVVYARITP